MLKHDYIYMYFSDFKSILDEKTSTVTWKDLQDIVIHSSVMVDDENNKEEALKGAMNKILSNELIYLSFGDSIFHMQNNIYDDKFKLKVGEFFFINNIYWIGIGLEEEFGCPEHTNRNCRGVFSESCLFCQNAKIKFLAFTKVKFHWPEKNLEW